MSWTFKIENGDLVRGSTPNGYEAVSGKAKLKQDCRMVLTTDIRPDGVGSSLRRIIGKSPSNSDSAGENPVMFEFQLMVRGSINRFQSRQRSVQFSRRTPSEILNDFSPVYISPDPDDPRKFKWRVDFFSMENSVNFSLGGSALR